MGHPLIPKLSFEMVCCTLSARCDQIPNLGRPPEDSMLHTRIALLVTICVASLCATPFAEHGNASDLKSKRNLEMTEVDVFGSSDWTSKNVRILGFRLGMTKADANENVHRLHLGLRCVDYCDVCNSENTLCNGIGLRFGSDQRVQKMFVVQPLTEAPERLKRFSVTQKFKGQTYAIFHAYSDALRIKLFGQESHREEDAATRTTTYSYPKLGVDLRASLPQNQDAPEANLIATSTFPVH